MRELAKHIFSLKIVPSKLQVLTNGVVISAHHCIPAIWDIAALHTVEAFWNCESEWRILFFQDLLKKRLLIDPRDEKNVEEHVFFKSLTVCEQEKLKYLAPLDRWFALIIYPSFVKNKAQQDESARIREEIIRLQRNPKDHGNKVEGGNWPAKIDLDACRNF